jgi:uncharacterized membrane protein
MNYKQYPFVGLLIMIVTLAVIYGAFFLNRYFNTTTNVLNIDGTRDMTAIALSALWSLLALVGVLVVFAIIGAFTLKKYSPVAKIAKSCKAVLRPPVPEQKTILDPIIEIPEVRLL